MTVTVKKSKAVGTVVAPPSKSVAHRALICAALSPCSTVKNLAFSKDIEATLKSLEALGANIQVCGNDVKIGGLLIENLKNDTPLPCNESGSTLRFLLPLCMCNFGEITLRGTEKLFTRPLSVYREICENSGIYYKQGKTSVTVGGVLKAGEYSVRGDISSQFITGLLYALPLLSGDSKIVVTGDFESESYVDITLSVLSQFGVEIVKKENVFYIKGNQTYKSTKITVEGDCSNAAFLEAFNLLGGDVEVLGVNNDTLQGDRVYKDMFAALKNGKSEFDLSDCPDLAPVMFALSAYMGCAHFVGTKRLKIKESDRGAVMAEELKKFGADVIIGENEITVTGGNLHTPEEILNGHNDHRIVMSLSLLCSVYGGEIAGAEAVSKSYPDFFNVIQSLKIGIEQNDTEQG